MALFRSVTVGLLGACLYFVVQLSRSEPEPVPLSAPVTIASAPVAPITVIDVAPGVTAAMIPSLVRFGPNEHITAVDDVPVANDLAAGAVLADRLRGSGRYVDLTVDRDGSQQRRVLVLLH